jgi:hypothetical protein
MIRPRMPMRWRHWRDVTFTELPDGPDARYRP